MKSFSGFVRAAVVPCLLLFGACQPEVPQTGSQTNWFKACDVSEECGSLKCICGTCTANCSGDDSCSEEDSAACVEAMDAGAIALCDGKPPNRNLCLARCDDASCPDGTSCVAGVCAPFRQPNAHVSVDPSLRHQTLIGFGASLAYSEDLIVSHPDKVALFDVMFSESGLDVIRLENRVDGDNANDLASAGEIVTAAANRLGRDPVLFMTSGSPPGSLKANGSTFCSSSDPECTLSRNVDGDFDYAGFAEYWRASLEAYATHGVHPNYVSIQSNADWIPSEDMGPEACRFLPEEGSVTLTTPDGDVEAEFPGYRRALEEVRAAVSGLDGTYAFAAPEVGSPIMVGQYADVLPTATYDALALHLYGVEPDDIPVDQFESLRVLSEETGKPVIQSEMAADGFGTAVLVHYTLTLADGAAYLQQPFVSETMDQASSALVGVDGERIQILPVHHALAHFARTTDPGWVRVDAASNSSDVLSSAWLSPDETSITIVLINPSSEPIDVQVDLEGSLGDLLEGARVTRSTFDAVERSAALGRLSAARVVRVPERSVVTLATAE